MKTLAYEISEQLAQKLMSEHTTPWQAPDWYFQSVSGGLGPLGVQKGFSELLQMGLIQQMPAIACIQAEGCAPMVHAFRSGLEKADPVLSPRTHIATLATGDPGRTYTLLYQRMKASGGGVFESVADAETFRTMHILARLEGLSVEPAAAVAFSGLIKLTRLGVVRPEHVIVVNCTGHTMPIERDILGDGWSRDVDVPSTSSGEAATEQEGLLAALSRVAPDRYSRILIVDDTEDARRLIRRILQSQGSYTISEAENGHQALDLAHVDPPDLILLDLMMPELDGFAVLDALKSDPNTAAIPVIVVTAKSLTAEEKSRLGGRIQSLMQKGEFMSDDLLQEVGSLLK